MQWWKLLFVIVFSVGLVLPASAVMTIYHEQTVNGVKQQLKKHQQDYYKDVILDNSKLNNYRLPNVNNTRSRVVVYQGSHVLIPKSPISIKHYDIPITSYHNVHSSLSSLTENHDIVRVNDFCQHCKENCRLGNPIYTQVYNHLQQFNYCAVNVR